MNVMQTANLLSTPATLSSVRLLLCVVTIVASDQLGLTTGSNRSLRSLGRANARPLTKRYVCKE